MRGEPLWEGPSSLDVGGETAGWTVVGDAAVEEVATPLGPDAAAVVVRGDGATATPKIKTNLIPFGPRDVVEVEASVRRVGSSADSLGKMLVQDYDIDGNLLGTIDTWNPSLAADTWVAHSFKRERTSEAARFFTIEWSLVGTPAAGAEYWWDEVVIRRSAAPRLLAKGVLSITGPTAGQASVTDDVDINAGEFDGAPRGLLYLLESSDEIARPLPHLVFSAGGAAATLMITGTIERAEIPATRLRVTATIHNYAAVNLSANTYRIGYAVFDDGEDW